MSMPSLSSSPWMRGAPQAGFSRHILRIRSRTSREMSGRPGWPRRTFQVQNNRNPARCQARTVSGLTMASAERQSCQRRDRQIHNRRSAEVQFQAFCRRSLKHSDLVAQSQVLEVEGGTRLEDRANRRKEVRKISMSENYKGCVTPYPLRYFDIFERHRLRVVSLD